MLRRVMVKTRQPITSIRVPTSVGFYVDIGTPTEVGTLTAVTLLACHLFQRFLRRRSLRRFNRLSFAARDAAIPFQLDMKHPLVRRAERFHDRVLRRGLM